MKKSLWVLTLPVLALLTQPIFANDGHSAENALDWSGIYSGGSNCTECTGLSASLTLNQNKTYRLQEIYEQKGKTAKEQLIEGKFRFLQNKPNVIELDAKAGHRQYFVSENFIEALPLQGNSQSGQLRLYKAVPAY